ncbi:hypothetical protein [Streptomyces spiramenti]|uniref:YtxH domain-containing protein n=1 Tax=Streptomyces spiramenti TaxID=2720606 RepID=A0ABX1ACF3_9ACTN|nr:hypothetical protein [Streptomyces spiramenti]NJP64884.1 hypothetical protein [Streptomyces spiramenti]
MNNSAGIGAAVACGYLLGRTKKAKVALGVGIYLVGRRAAGGGQGGVALPPVLADLGGQVRDELLPAVRDVARQAVAQRVERFSDSLAARRNPAEPEEWDEEWDEDAELLDEEPEDEPPAPRNRKTTTDA